MKNSIKLIAIVIITAGIMSCSSMNNQSRSAYDEVYFIPGKSDLITSSETDVNDNQSEVPRPEPLITNHKSESAYNDKESQYYQENSDNLSGNQNIYNQNTVNNYYYNQPNYDFRYSQRIRRFHRPHAGFGYHHTFYSWPYFTYHYPHHHYYSGRWSVTFRYSNRPYYHYYNPWFYSYYPYYPYHGYYYYPGYFMPHYNYSLGFHSAYYHGYYSGYHTGLWTSSTIGGSGSGTVIKPAGNKYSGPRGSTGGSNIGGNISSSSTDHIRSGRFEAPPLNDKDNEFKISDAEVESKTANEKIMNPHERRQSYPQSERTRDSYSGSSANQKQTSPRNQGANFEYQNNAPRQQSFDRARNESGTIDNNRSGSPTYRRNDVFSSPGQSNPENINSQPDFNPRSQPGTSSPNRNDSYSPRNNTSSPSESSPRRSGGRR